MIIKTLNFIWSGSKKYKYPYIRIPKDHSLAENQAYTLYLDYIGIIVPPKMKRDEIKKHLKIIMEKL